MEEPNWIWFVLEVALIISVFSIACSILENLEAIKTLLENWGK